MMAILRTCLFAVCCLTISCPVWARDTLDFTVDIMSVLSKAGCNAGTCHGNLNGKGGLKLSLRGQDPWADYERLTKAARGRRINLAAPTESLILRKGTGAVPHTGGVRFDRDSTEYADLLHWISVGAVGPADTDKQLVKLEVMPRSAVVLAPESTFQVHVVAHFSDGHQRDVTTRACYELSNLNATVNSQGQVSRTKFGETTLIVRYLDQQVPVQIGFRNSHPDYQWNHPTQENFVDKHIFAKLQKLRINLSPECNDSVFLRRAYLDAMGKLPTSVEARRYLSDNRPDKRETLIDHLLQRPGFADYWALKLADLLRVEEKVLDPQGVEVFHGWIRDCIQQGVGLDEMTRQLVTGTGSTFQQPAANYYRANRDPSTRGETTARLFLGTRLQCAKCHNHPYDRWTQDEYYQWANLFSQIDYELGENKRKDKLDKNEFAGEQTVLKSKQPEVKNPTTDLEVTPRFLGGRELNEQETQDRLAALAAWLTSKDNDLFAQSQVNFVWFHLMGKGLVDPVDDFRITNPASNQSLLEALATHFVASQYNLRSLVRTIMLSRVYRTSSEPVASNHDDETNYSRAYVRRYPAEVLLDMQSDVLALPAEFTGFARGVRAVQIPGVEKIRKREKPPMAGDRFLKTFGKPERILACDCERSNETNLKQVLGLVGSELDARLKQSPRLKRLAVSRQSDQEVLEELYLSALARRPTREESDQAVKLIAQFGRKVAFQDLTWAILNAKEFLFRR